jgi:hypothetical protein
VLSQRADKGSGSILAGPGQEQHRAGETPLGTRMYAGAYPSTHEEKYIQVAGRMRFCVVYALAVSERTEGERCSRQVGIRVSEVKWESSQEQGKT